MVQSQPAACSSPSAALALHPQAPPPDTSGTASDTGWPLPVWHIGPALNCGIQARRAKALPFGPLACHTMSSITTCERVAAAARPRKGAQSTIGAGYGAL